MTMRTMMTTLGIVGALVATSATPTLARTKHYRGPMGAYAAAPYAGPYGPAFRAYAADPFMQEPRGFRMGRGWGSQSPRYTTRPSQSWDPYGMRWDGGQ